ncbi:MAG TPA: anthranilate 1,2-dioxygenase large subunit, partial [Acinetobacter nosocomialis]|nr:anthranilate 1,2-dioxygenase large subunit [Acinetobacter nosocomialis]
QDLGIQPVITGREFTHEGLYVNQHGHWQRLMLDGLNKKALKMQDITFENNAVMDDV